MQALVVTEPKGRYPENKLARADGELPAMREDGTPVEWDLTIVSPMSVDGGELVHAAQEPGYVVEKAANAKRKKYIDNGLLQREDRPTFFPVVFNTFGRRNKAAGELFRALAQHGEDLQWGPKWRWWLTEVPKLNAMLMKGNFQKVKTLRVMSFKEYDNRYREAATGGG